MSGDREVLRAALVRLLERQAGPAAGKWFALLPRIQGPPFVRSLLARAFASASRHLGKHTPDIKSDEAVLLRDSGLGGMEADQIGRVALLLVAAAAADDDLVATVDGLYRRGDNRERQAILKSLSLLPSPGRFLHLGVDACRSHVQPIFEAIACANRYPADHFPDLNFNQMVLKALFIDVALDRIEGLRGRVTPDLERMAAAYASERRAAGRSVPEDINRLVAV